ncbi:MAG: hypothetical protein HQL46_03105, partial [Gammaproteobacteria bacterium]|nr:hypothetical protein [Gammaproteobacteria bacterium]
MLNNAQLDEIKSLLTKANENTNLFNALDPLEQSNTKFQKKLSNAIASYATNIKAEDVLVLHDDTAFGSAKDGFIITHDAIYYRALMEDPGSIKFLDSIEITNEESKTFFVGGTKIKMDLLNETVITIAHVLKKIVEFNCVPTGNELISKTLTDVAEWIKNVNHEDKMEVYNPFIKVVKEFESHNDLNKILIELINSTEYIKDYELPDAQKQMDKVYQLIKVDGVQSFDNLIRMADSLATYGFKQQSRNYYKAAEGKITSVAQAISLAQSLDMTYDDKNWSKNVYLKAQKLSTSYNDFYDVGLSSGGTFDDFASENLLMAYEKICQSIDDVDKSLLVSIADSLLDYGQDKVNVQKIVRDYLDNYASDFKDYKNIFSVASGDDYLNDLSLSQEIFSKAKALCKTYADY